MSTENRVPAGAGPKLAIIVPAYNAGKTIEGVFQRIDPHLQARIVNYTVVDDGSTDDTAEALGRLKARYAQLDVLRHEENRGYGAAEKTLLAHALGTDAEVFVLLHADGQYAPEAVARLVQPFAAGQADLVQGSRMLHRGDALRGGMPYYKYVANRTLTWVANRAFGMRLAEYHSGMMLYSRRAVEQVPFEKLTDSFCFDQEMLIMAMVKGLKIVQLPIPTHYGDEVSHLKPIRYGMATLSLIWAFRRGYYHAL